MSIETFSCRKHSDRRLSVLLKKAVVFLPIVCILFMLIYNLQMIPAIIPFAKAQATTEITQMLQKIIRDTVTDGSYSDFVTLNYEKDGGVVSLETDTASIAAVNASITEAAIAKLRKNDRLTVSIPLGTLSGDALFMGRGPDMDIKLAISRKVTCNIENEFYESGINQTIHRIMAHINVEAYILLPLEPQKIDVNTEYCIAETVIVGKVPDAYTKINRLGEDDDLEESDIDDIFDFGATLD